MFALFFIFKYKQPMFGKLSSQPLLISRSTRPYRCLLNIYAIDHMVLSDADTLMKLNPFGRFYSQFNFLNEKVRKYQIIAMIVAILGMLFIVKPEFSSTMITSLLDYFLVFLLPLHTCVRALSTRAPYTIVFIFHYFQLSF